MHKAKYYAQQLIVIWMVLHHIHGKGPELDILRKLEERLSELEEVTKDYKDSIESLTRQLSLQQFYAEETVRSNGDSGLKITRLNTVGSRPYHTTSFSDSRVAAIHDHANYVDTVGLGELVVVLNGVEFRTRHNDYKFVMPSRKSKSYGATERIQFPTVPPEVLRQPTIEKQSEEMRLWFKAWRDQDFSRRDYRKYFKPVLCYMEGMWTESDLKTLQEPFSSDRHSIDADSYLDLQDKAMYTSGTGRKNIFENYASLPSKVVGTTKKGLPIFSQWNYNILCHPLKNDLPFHRIRMEDDIGPRVARLKTFEQAIHDRFARFSLWPNIGGANQFKQSKDSYTSKLTGSYLDELMSEIPGKDNYQGELKDDVFNELALKFQQEYASKKVPLNVAYYHRLYKTDRKDAMGTDIMFRSFSDPNLYVAYNSRPQITPYNITTCTADSKCNSKEKATAKTTIENQGCEGKVCTSWSHRVSFAIPLEIIYLTPLQSWNPYNLSYFPDEMYPKKLKLNRTGGGNDSLTVDYAYFGTSKAAFYQTPSEFYQKEKEKVDSADSSYGSINVLDSQGIVRRTVPSGVYVTLPSIEGVGVLRQRYPIMPLHVSPGAVYKELEALKDLVLRGSKYQMFYRDRRVNDSGFAEEVFSFDVGSSSGSDSDVHFHTVDLSETEIRALKAGKRITAVTSSDSGHDHRLTLEYRVAHYPNNVTLEHLYLVDCDGAGWRCWDGHKGWVICNECINGFPSLK